MHEYMLTMRVLLLVLQLLQTAHPERYCVLRGRHQERKDAYLDHTSVMVWLTVWVV